MMAPSTSPLQQAKAALRSEMQRRRPALVRPDAAEKAAEYFFRQVPWPAGAIVGGTWPMTDEFDPLPLMTRLAAQGSVTSLPVIAGRAQPLGFRAWSVTESPPPGRYGIPAPGPDCRSVQPGVLLVPLLAFDASGWRLGYGGGYYDRTISSFRAAGGVLAVGLAYAGQEVPDVPHDANDMRLDWIVTEREARRFA